MNRDIIYNIFNNVDHPLELYKMANLCKNFLQMYSNNRYKILHQIFINHILNNDKHLTNHFKQLKKIWMSNGATYNDDHLTYDPICKIDKLAIILRYKNCEILTNNIAQNGSLIYPSEWIIPTSSKFRYQCKNRLYIKDDTIHLSTFALGATLYNEQLKELHLNKFLVQKYLTSNEINLLLTLDEFNHIFA